MTVADVVADGLRRAGARRVFAVADAADPTLLTAVRAADLPVISVCRAASACVMAAVTAGLGAAPGAVLLGNDDAGARRALAAAMRDRAPTIVVASSAPLETIAKTTVDVGADSAAHWIAHAAHAAMEDPPGPVWLIVSPAIVARTALSRATVARPAVAPADSAEVESVVRALAAAARPLVIAGRECRASGAAGWLRAFAESLPAPVVVTPSARGALPDPHPLCFGPLRADAAILARADLVLALGVDADELDVAGVRFTAPLLRLANVVATLEELAPRVRALTRADWDVAELDRLRRDATPPLMTPGLTALVARLREATPAGTVAVFARQFEAATSPWLAVSPGELLVADDVVPAAVAAALERPEGMVLGFAGGARDDACADIADAVAAGVRVVTPSSVALAHALGEGLAAIGPRVIVVPTAG